MLTIQIARFMVGCSWIYHGLFPKLLTIAPTEKLMTARLGFSPEVSYLITKSAGVGEILFGLLFIICYKVRALVLLNIVVLIMLLLFVALMRPLLLIEAFNPLTTNLSLVALSFILLHELKRQEQKS